MDTPITDPFMPTPIPRLVILPFPSLPDVRVKSWDSSTTTDDDPLSASADSEFILWFLLNDLWSLWDSWLVLLCKVEELLFLVLIDCDPCTDWYRFSGDLERYGL